MLSRKLVPGEPAKAEAIRFATLDTVGSLLLALLINAAILVLAGGAFHCGQGAPVTGIESAYHLLDPVVGTLSIPCWQRRLITRVLALAPAFIGLWLLGGAHRQDAGGA